MSDLLRRDRQQRIENEINDNIDYNGKANITFKQNFPFHMQVLPAGSRESGTGWIDRDMFQDLTQARVLNWCRTADSLFPVSTKSDGNCLCHAVSTALWGIPDDSLTLRNLICVSIDSGQNKERWRSHYENQASQTNRESLRLNASDWEKEWKHVIDTAMSTTRASTVAAVPHAHLEAIHIFSLANILRRPIIVLADSTARTLSGTSLQESDIGGIYLPLNWPPGDCQKHPIVLGYTMSHFCPLLPQESTDKSLFTVPIVTRDCSFLPIRFLTTDEEKRAANLLKIYLKIKEVAFSSSETMELVLCTEVKKLPLPNTSNVITAITPENTTPNISAAGLASSNFNTVPCITQGCKFFGSPATGNMCSSCLIRYLEQQAEQSSSAEPSAPPPSMPLSGPGQCYDLSMMGETCTNGCGYRCSTQTFPYCHECAERQRAVSQGQTAGVTESALFGTGSVTQEKRLDSTESRRCRGEGCDREGKPYLGSLCDKCYMDAKRTKQICSTPGCTGTRVNGSYCIACQNPPTAGGFDPNVFPVNGANMIPFGKDQQPTGLPEKQEESETRGNESSSSLIESGTRCNAETPSQVILTGPEDKIHCASPMCNALIYPPHKLCQRCIDILMQSQATSSHQQQQQLLEPTVVSLKENDITQTWGPTGRSNTGPIAVRSQMMRVQLSETTRPSSAPIGWKCLTPGCTRFGDPSTSDLCTNCYTKTVGSPRSLSVGSANIDDFAAMMTRVEAQKRCSRHCKAANCTNYGNPNNEGFCNSCYPRYMMMKQGLS